MRDELAKLDPIFAQCANRPVMEANLIAVADSQRKLTLPSDYKYDDAKPKSVVTPKAIFEPEVKIEKGESPRARLCALDDFVRESAFRQEHRQSDVEAVVRRGVDRTRGRHSRRLRGDQSRAAGVPDEGNDPRQIRPQGVSADPVEHAGVPATSELRRGDSRRGVSLPRPDPAADDRGTGVGFVLTLAQFHELDDYHREPSKLLTEIVKLDLAKATPQQIVDSLKEFNTFTGGKATRERTKPFEYQGQVLVRASELPSPLPPGHFLRQFGQSDREQIEASSLDGSVPQVLQMFNGPITHMMLDPQSIMYRNVTAEKDPEKRVDVIFVSVLCRKPLPEEKRAALDEIKKHGNAGYGNVIWSLVNTPEFLFVQ